MEVRQQCLTHKHDAGFIAQHVVPELHMHVLLAGKDDWGAACEQVLEASRVRVPSQVEQIPASSSCFLGEQVSRRVKSYCAGEA